MISPDLKASHLSVHWKHVNVDSKVSIVPKKTLARNRGSGKMEQLCAFLIVSFSQSSIVKDFIPLQSVSECLCALESLTSSWGTLVTYMRQLNSEKIILNE